MMYVDDAGVVSTSPRGLTRMMDVIAVACQEFELTVSEKKPEAIHLWSHPSTGSNALRIEAAEKRLNRRPSLRTLVLSARVRTLTPR